MCSSIRENIDSLGNILLKCQDCLEYYPKDYLNNFGGRDICDFCISEYYAKTPPIWGSFSFFPWL